MKVNSFIESFSVIKTEEVNHNLSQLTEIENRIPKAEIFRSKENPSNELDKNFQSERNSSNIKKCKTCSVIKDENVVLKGDPVTIICQNINYYIGNKEDIWKNAGTVGLELQTKGVLSKEEMKEKEEIEKKEFKEIVEGEQSINDGKLEFFTFQSGVSYDVEGTLSGFAEKIYHGKGPVLIKFKDTPSKNENDKENRIYLNVDGSYFHIVKPEEIRVRPNKNYHQGKLKFLCKKKE